MKNMEIAHSSFIFSAESRVVFPSVAHSQFNIHLKNKLVTHESKCSKSGNLTNWTANVLQGRTESEIWWWFANLKSPQWILDKNVALSQSWYWGLSWLWRQCFGFVLTFWPSEGPQLGARWAHRKWGSDSQVCPMSLSRLGAGRLSTNHRKSRWIVEAEECTAEGSFTSILSNAIPSHQCWLFLVSNCATARRKQFSLIKMLKSFTPNLSSHGVLSEFKSTVPLIPKYLCPSVWVWKTRVPLSVLSILVSPEWSLSTLTGRRILPENTAIHLPVRRLRENNFRPHFTGSQSRLRLGFKSSLFCICVCISIFTHTNS